MWILNVSLIIDELSLTQFGEEKKIMRRNEGIKRDAVRHIKYISKPHPHLYQNECKLQRVKIIWKNSPHYHDMM